MAWLCTFVRAGKYGRANEDKQPMPDLETEIALVILCYLFHKTLKGNLPEEELCVPLVMSDLAQRHCAWPVPPLDLDTAVIAPRGLARPVGCLICRLGRYRHSRSLTTRRLTGRLLGTRHARAPGSSAPQKG